MEALFARILNARHKRFFGSKPVFERYKPATDIANVEARIGVSLPDALKTWLGAAGYGDINEVLSFRSEWFNVIERGELKGHVVFAQDILGNSYSFAPADGTIHFICRSAPEYAFVSKHFSAFLEELEQRNSQLEAWTDGLAAQRYEGDT
jgi:hypothetical protein